MYLQNIFSFGLRTKVCRLIRNVLAVFLRIRYDRHILHLWFRFSDRYGAAILIALWILILASLALAARQLYLTRRTLKQVPA